MAEIDPASDEPSRQDAVAGPELRPLPDGRLVVAGAGRSHRGLVRAVNEDAILTDPTGVLWAVADGMGGHGHGDLAADLVIDALAHLPHGGVDGDLLRSGLAAGHDAVRRRALSDGLGDIGATVVALMVEDAQAVVGWAGDSRAYLLRAGALTPLTRDHSVVQELVDRAGLSAREAESHPEAHVVTRAIGIGDAAEPEFVALSVAAGDVLLLCSDGLTRCVPEPEIAALLADAAEPEAAAAALIAAALAHGAPDNVSAIVLHVGRAGA